MNKHVKAMKKERLFAYHLKKLEKKGLTLTTDFRVVKLKDAMKFPENEHYYGFQYWWGYNRRTGRFDRLIDKTVMIY